MKNSIPSVPSLSSLSLSSSPSLPILYEDDAVVVIDKPAGVAVHPGAGIEMSDTIVGRLLKSYPDLPKDNGGDRPGIVHRLDKDTSGVLLVAKTSAALAYYIDAWKKHAVKKEYVALVKGVPDAPRGIIESPIRRDPKDRKKMIGSMRDGKMAVTSYELQKSFPKNSPPCSLLKIEISSGRTHQIRVHLSEIGHPVLGDTLYGSRTTSRDMVAIGLNRQFLHASRLVFPLFSPSSSSSRKKEVISPLPSDLSSVLSAL